jgi:hypothetical protein
VSHTINFAGTENLVTEVDVVVTPDSTTALIPTNDALGGVGGHLRIINIATGNVSHTINFGSMESLMDGVDVVVTPDGATALMPTNDALGGVGGHLRIIDIATGNVSHTINFAGTEGLTNGVDVVLTIDPNTVLMPTNDALGGVGGHLRIINIATGLVSHMINFGATEVVIAGVDAVACLGSPGCPVSLDEDFPPRHGYTSTRYWTDFNDVRYWPPDGDWMDPCNWDPVGVPDFNDSAFIGYDNYAPFGGIAPVLDVDAGTIGKMVIGSYGIPSAGITKVIVRTGGNLFVDKTSFADSAGEILTGSTTGCPGQLIMTGGSLGGFVKAQFGKKAEGVLNMCRDDVNDPGGSPVLQSSADGYLALGAQDGGTGDAKVYLDNGTIHTAGLQFYRDESYMNITAGTLEAGPGRMPYYVEESCDDMLEYIENLCYAKESLQCYGGEGEINIELDSPQIEWVTVWCDAREPNCAAFPKPKRRATVGPYEAKCPEPVGSLAKLKLVWQPGATADKHDVYLGTDFDDVNEGLGGTFKQRVDVNEYPTSGLHLGTDYYWRIAEVNGTDVVCTGPVWQFTVPHCIYVDDFENYSFVMFPTGSNWDYDPDFETIIWLQQGSTYYDAHSGFKSMLIDYAEINGEDNYGDVFLEPAYLTDWTYGGEAVALTFWYAAPVEAEQIQVRINNNSFFDIGAALDECWHQANASFTELGGGATNVTQFTIRIGDGSYNGLDGYIYIDDIAVCESRCVPDRAPQAGDVTGDCTVDNMDLRQMALCWLCESPWPTGCECGQQCDICPSAGGDGIVNLKDYTELADNWGQTTLWP